MAAVPEGLEQQGRPRDAQTIARRETVVAAFDGAGFVLAAIALALLGDSALEWRWDVGLALTLAFAVTLRARFDTGAVPIVLSRPTALLLSSIALALPATANAGVLTADAPDCSAQSADKVFLPWADPADYVLAPGGAAESADGWQLSGGAAVVDGSEPYAVHSADDVSALRLPPGASATTATMCVGIEHPTIRFFTRSASVVGGRVGVEVLFETSSGQVASAPVGVDAGGAWSPTSVMPVTPSLLTLLPGNHTPVRFRFTSTGSSAITIDDVYVDPFGRY